MPKKLSHYDRAGRARMVDVSGKTATRREAEASAFVAMSPAVLAAFPENPKGDPLEVARIAGIMAAKRTSELIPMCHPLPLSIIDVDLRLCENGVAITSKVATTAETGVEMEALVAAKKKKGEARRLPPSICLIHTRRLAAAAGGAAADALM